MKPSYEQAGWDKRTWLLGLIGGNLCGALTSFSSFPALGGRLNSVFPKTLWGWQTTDLIFHVSWVVGLLILPALLSGISRRHFFRWGLLPILVMWLWLDAGVLAQDKRDFHTLSGAYLLFSLSCGLLASGPVALTRDYILRKRMATHIAYKAQEKAASGPQEDAWPPPPRLNS